MSFPKNKDVLMLIGSSDGKDFAPYEEDCDIWGINSSAEKLLRYDVIFQLHNLDILPQELIDFLGGVDKPVCVQKLDPRIPTGIEYPKDKILTEFGESFFSTFDWQMALAISLGYKKILIYGFDMAVQGEYEFQRPSAFYYIGLARGRGIEVEIQKDCGLNVSGVYAYGESFDQEYAATLIEIYTLKNKVNEQDSIVNFNQGVITDKDKKQAAKDLVEAQTLKEYYEDELYAILDKLSERMGYQIIIPEKEIGFS